MDDETWQEEKKTKAEQRRQVTVGESQIYLPALSHLTPGQLQVPWAPLSHQKEEDHEIVEICMKRLCLLLLHPAPFLT